MKYINFKLFILCFLILSADGSVIAQSFSNPIANPFSLKPKEVRQTPCPIDLDGDGDYDILTGSTAGTFQYYQNIGNPKLPKYADPIANPFGLKTAGPYSRPVLGDLDQDGDFDLLVGSERGDLEYFQNIGTQSVPKFTSVVLNPFLLNPNRQYFTPFLVDLDGDNDLDLIAGTESNGIVYQENIGTSKLPKFADVLFNPFLIEPSGTDLIPALADLDKDGDMDLLVANQTPAFEYFENSGTKFIPSFLPPKTNPFSIKPNTGDPSPFLVDLDYDGDLDLLTGQTSKFNYYENTQIIISIKETTEDFQIELYPNPANEEIIIHVFDLSKFKFSGIYNSNLNLIRSNPNSQINKIDLSNLSSGLYYLKIEYLSKIHFIKFLKI